MCNRRDKGQQSHHPRCDDHCSTPPKDHLTIALKGVPDPSTTTVQIDDQGLIALSFIGPHPAAGVSVDDLHRDSRRLYRKKIYTPVDVSVSATEPYVYVGGGVAKPGRII